jgi:protein SCO1/2
MNFSTVTLRAVLLAASDARTVALIARGSNQGRYWLVQRVRRNGAMSALRIIQVATIASVGALVTAIIVLSQPSQPAKQAVSVPIGGSFELVDQDGMKVTDKTFSGKPSVIFFGYTSCPDVCPTTLLNLTTWLKAIGPDADKLNVLFISIDPERDTSAHLKEYLSSFDPRIRGLTGTDKQIAAVANEFHAIYFKDTPLAEGGYAMAHTKLIYLMDRTGKLVESISLPTEDKFVIDGLRQLAAS